MNQLFHRSHAANSRTFATTAAILLCVFSVVITATAQTESSKPVEKRPGVFLPKLFLHLGPHFEFTEKRIGIDAGITAVIHSRWGLTLNGRTLDIPDDPTPIDHCKQHDAMKLLSARLINFPGKQLPFFLEVGASFVHSQRFKETWTPFLGTAYVAEGDPQVSSGLSLKTGALLPLYKHQLAMAIFVYGELNPIRTLYGAGVSLSIGRLSPFDHPVDNH